MNANATYTPLQQYFLGRLESLVDRLGYEVAFDAHVFPEGVPKSPVGEARRLRRRLLDRAIYATYLDCLEAGVGEEAGSSLGQLRQSLSELKSQPRPVPVASESQVPDGVETGCSKS